MKSLLNPYHYWRVILTLSVYGLAFVLLIAEAENVKVYLLTKILAIIFSLIGLVLYQKWRKWFRLALKELED